MSNPDRYFTQNDFSGGICTQDSELEKNQVLDATNMWYNQGVLSRKPGTTSKLIGDPAAAPLASKTGVFPNGRFNSTLVAAYITSAAGVTNAIAPSGGNFNVSGHTPGGRLTFVFRIPGAQAVLPGSCYGIRLEMPTASGNSNATWFQCEILTERGFIGVNHYSRPRHLFNINNTIGPTGYQHLWFSSPRDSIVDLSKAPAPFTSTDYGLVISFAIMQNAIDANTIVNGTSSAQFSNFNTQPLATAGAYRLQFNNSSKILVVQTADISTGLDGGLAVTNSAPPFAIYSMRDRFMLSPEHNFADSIGSAPNTYAYQFLQSFTGKPPVVVTIPFLNFALCAYRNKVTVHPADAPYGTLTPNPYYLPSNAVNPGPDWGASQYNQVTNAQVNNDPALTGPTDTSQGTIGIWPKDTVPQLDVFPEANLLLFYNNTLFAADFPGASHIIRWTTDVASGGWNIWPDDSLAPLSTNEDNSGITALNGLNDNPVAYKKNSIWLMINNGVNSDNLVQFEPRRVVTGVGTSSHQSVVNIPQGNMFLSEDGFYIFDGTPNIKRVSDAIRGLIQKITPLGKISAQAVNWRTKQMYLCATQIHQNGNEVGQINNVVFAYNYRDDSWWFFDNWNVNCWYLEDGPGLEERLWFIDSWGRAFVLNNSGTHDGELFEPRVLTGRFGEAEINSKTAMEFRVLGINNNGPATCNLIYDDINDYDHKVFSMPLTSESKYNSVPAPLYNQAKYTPERHRERTVKTPVVSAKWFQIEAKNFNEITQIALGVSDKGNRT